MFFKLVFELGASALLGCVQTICGSPLMTNGHSRRYRIYTAMSVERWRDSDSEEGMWKPWNVDTHPDSTIVSIWDKPLSLLITFGLWFPSISLLFNYKSKLKRIFLLQKIYSSQCYPFFFNLNLIQKINFLVSLDSHECQ